MAISAHVYEQYALKNTLNQYQAEGAFHREIVKNLMKIVQLINYIFNQKWDIGTMPQTEIYHLVWIIKVPLYSCFNSKCLFLLVNENQANIHQTLEKKFSQNTKKKLLQKWQKISFLHSRATLSFNSNWDFFWFFVHKADCRHNFLNKEIKTLLFPKKYFKNYENYKTS